MLAVACRSPSDCVGAPDVSVHGGQSDRKQHRVSGTVDSGLVHPADYVSLFGLLSSGTASLSERRVMRGGGSHLLSMHRYPDSTYGIFCQFSR